MTPRARRQPRPAPLPVDRYIYVQAGRCKGCGSKRLPAYRSSKSSDGTVARHVVCADCHAKWILVIE